MSLHKLAMEYGAGCNVLLLDEIFSYIDNTNAQKIVDAFSHSTNYGVVLMTDNSDKIRNMLGFDETWTVEKRNGISSLHVRS